MSYQPRHSIYPPSSSQHHHHQASSSISSQSSALQSRIAAKRAEMHHLQELRDLSATLAAQMAALEARLGTLRDGTEAVACVMANWEGVLKAISMAGAKVATATAGTATTGMKENGEERDNGAVAAAMELPRTLVRIPVGQHLQHPGEEKGGEGRT